MRNVRSQGVILIVTLIAVNATIFSDRAVAQVFYSDPDILEIENSAHNKTFDTKFKGRQFIGRGFFSGVTENILGIFRKSYSANVDIGTKKISCRVDGGLLEAYKGIKLGTKVEIRGNIHLYWRVIDELQLDRSCSVEEKFE